MRSSEDGEGRESFPTPIFDPIETLGWVRYPVINFPVRFAAPECI